MDHIYLTVRERGHVQVTVGTGDDVGDYAKILASDEALALAFIELVVVVVNFVFKFGIGEGELSSALVEGEFEQVSALCWFFLRHRTKSTSARSDSCGSLSSSLIAE